MKSYFNAIAIGIPPGIFVGVLDKVHMVIVLIILLAGMANAQQPCPQQQFSIREKFNIPKGVPIKTLLVKQGGARLLAPPCEPDCGVTLATDQSVSLSICQTDAFGECIPNTIDTRSFTLPCD